MNDLAGCVSGAQHRVGTTKPASIDTRKRWHIMEEGRPAGARNEGKKPAAGMAKHSEGR